MNKDPVYIEESDELVLLRKYHTPESLKLQSGHANMGFLLLKNALFMCYGHTQFSHLVERSNLHEESIAFSRAIRVVIENEKWSRSTAYAAFRALKIILEKTNVNTSFIAKIAMIKKESAKSSILSRKYELVMQNENEKNVLEELTTLARTRTRMKSNSSLRIFLTFVLHLLERNDISILEYQKITLLPYETIHQSILSMNQPKLFRTHIHYAMIFVCNMLNKREYLVHFEATKRTVQKKFGTREDTDVHRISREELEAMFEATSANIKFRAIFLLMVSTGMRTFGVSNIKLVNVCTIVNNNIIINKVGRTIEKGNKWFSFSISDSLADVLHTYITTVRKSDSEYLFSSARCTNLSPNSISAIIKKIARLAGLTGKHIHAHSLRHSFAHILLETGNRPEMVSKMLGHTSTAITEQYYLKESAAEASKRMNIPWLVRQENYDPVPTFLNTKTAHRKSRGSTALKTIINDFNKCNATI